MELLWFLLIGAAAGWIAGNMMKGGGFGLIGNIIVGVIGGFIGGWLFKEMGVGGGGLIWQLVAAVVGAIILLFVVGLFKKA